MPASERTTPAPRPILHAVGLVAVLLVAAPAAAAPPTGPDAQARQAQRARVQAALGVQRRHAAALLGRTGPGAPGGQGDVVGVGTGLDAQGEPVIRVFTARPGVALPAELEGVPVRPRVTGRFHALRGATCEASGDGVCQSFERWPLPVPIGVSIGHPAITAGTIGSRVTDGVNVFALSNNHVLANSNLASVGDAALQPGPFDGGSVAASDTVGTLHDFEPILFCVVFPILCDVNYFDAALALTTPAEVGFATPAGEFGSAPGYGAPAPTIHPAYGDPAVLGDETLAQLLGVPVQKYGRTTELTTGTIDTIQLATYVCYDEACSLVAYYEDQLGINGAFSASGDSGSLVVTDDGLRHPVALLFGGSDTESVVSRIDRVLLRFGVTVDDGGATAPVADAAITGLATPSFALVNQTATIGVDVRNTGNQPLPAFDVTFEDETEGPSATQTAPALAPGASVTLDFAWTPAQTGPHSLRATHQLADDDPTNDEATAPVDVLLEPPGPTLELWRGTARTDTWTAVSLAADYGDQMVVVCTPQYDLGALGPLLAHVRNASGSGFEVGLYRPWFGAFPGDHGSAEVHCLAVREGVYDEATHLVRMEAVRLEGFAAKDDAYGWAGQAQPYAQAYTSPVVLGQVIGGGSGIPGEIGVWSSFWARGPTPQDPPSATTLYVGRHTGEDPGARSPTTLAYVVFEAGSGRLDGHAFTAGVGPDTVQGPDDAPPYSYALTTLDTATHAVASSAGMDGVEGAWPILYGANAVTATSLGLASEEDWYFDPERSHPSEQVAYVVFGGRRLRCGIGAELLLLLVPALRVWVRRLRCVGGLGSDRR